MQDIHPCVLEMTIFFSLNPSTSHSNMGIKKRQRKNFLVLSNSLCLRKKEMPHPSELPDFRWVTNAKTKEWEILSHKSAVPGLHWLLLWYQKTLTLQQAELVKVLLCSAVAGGTAACSVHPTQLLFSPPHGYPSARHRAFCWERSITLTKKIYPVVK